MNNGPCDRFCPPLMADGRFVTDYRPTRDVHQSILMQNGLCSSSDLRLFLQRNSVKLLKINREYYECRNQSGSCQEYYLPDPNGQILQMELAKQRLKNCSFISPSQNRSLPSPCLRE